MQYVFLACSSFDQPLDGWDVSNVTTMFGMLEGYHGPMAFNNGGSTGINNWQPSSCTNMTRVFEECTGFNQPLNGWDVSSATTMDGMFSKCTSFNQPLNNWDTSSVTNMSNMFSYALNFDQDLGSWNTSNVTNMYLMFGHSTSGLFNNGGSSSISGWDTSNVTDMTYLFLRCKLFNQPIGYWDTSSVTNIGGMLYDCDAFDQDLSNWIVTGITVASDFMRFANGLSITNYDSTLSGWSSQAVQNGVNIHFGGSQYSTATGAAFRSALVASGWTITDGGAV
jgi:surface protein